MSSEKLFSVKDKVFVKRRFYPAWPAIITGIKANTQSQPMYTVYFYGIGNYSDCTSEALCLYEENKYKLGKPRGKQKKFKKFVEALVQIEIDAQTSFVPNNNNTNVLRPRVSTSNINKQLSLEDESKNICEIEIQSKCNLKSEDNSINKLNLSKDVLGKKASSPSLVNNNNTNVLRPRVSTSNINQKLPLEDESKNICEIEIQSKCNLKSEDNSINKSNLSKDVLRKKASSPSSVNNNNTKVLRPRICTSNINQKLPLEDKSKNMGEIEIQSKCNLKSEDNFINELNLSKDVLKKRASYNSTDFKRKLSDVKHTEVQKKLIKSNISKPKEVQYLEQLKDTLLKSKTNGEQNSETAIIQVVSVDQMSETLNTTKSVHKSSDIPLNQSETAKFISINDNIASTGNMFTNSNSCRVSRFGRKIKPNKLSDQEFFTTVKKYLKKHNSESLNTHNTDSNTKTRSTLSNATLVPCFSDSSSHIICKLNSRQESISPIKNIMDSLSNKRVNEWEHMESNKSDKCNLLKIEVDLLDCVHDLRLALTTDYKQLNYELALKSLEQIREIQFNALMLIKHRNVIDSITKVTTYVGDLKNWSLSKHEAIEHIAKARTIRFKAYLVLCKFASLFTVLDGQTFLEVYNKKVHEFITKTQNWTNEQIYSCTSDTFFK